MAGWLVLDIGCIECMEPTTLVGVFSTKERAQEVRDSYEQSHELVGDTGHDVCIFELPSTDAEPTR